MENSFELSVINKNKQNEITKILECNKFLHKYGLQLSEKDVQGIEIKRLESLKTTGRLEFEEWIIERLIKEFCDSPYITQENFLDTIYELIDIFYYYKNETKDMVSDDELINFMKIYYDNLAQGDLEYLAGTIMERMKSNVLNNKPMDFNIKERRKNNEL